MLQNLNNIKRYPQRNLLSLVFPGGSLVPLLLCPRFVPFRKLLLLFFKNIFKILFAMNIYSYFCLFCTQKAVDCIIILYLSLFTWQYGAPGSYSNPMERRPEEIPLGDKHIQQLMSHVTHRASPSLVCNCAESSGWWPSRREFWSSGI